MESRDLPCLGRIRRESRKTDFVEFQPVQTPVKVAARTDGFGKYNAARIDSLKDV